MAGEGDPYAHVIHRVVCALPARIDADTIAKAEAHLVGQAAHFGPKELGRLGRHTLEVVAPELAEEAEARRLAELDANAADKTRLTMRRLGDGTAATELETAADAAPDAPADGRPPRRPVDDGSTRPSRSTILGIARQAIERQLRRG